MSEYRYIFAHRLPKRVCPSCGQKRLRTYIDTATQVEMDNRYGICDRVNSCGYLCVPSGADSEPYERKQMTQPVSRITTWRCPPEVVEMTTNSAGNVFAWWMVSTLGQGAVDVLRKYKVGTYPQSERNPHLSGSMVYWQIGHDGLHRSGKIIPYHPDGNRIKEIGSAWVHSIVYGKSMEDLGIGQCLFGEHLLHAGNLDTTVCLVESEKSALICATIYPQYLWLATGGSSMFTVSMCMCLSGRNVIVIPDVGMYHEWSQKAEDISIVCESMVVCDSLEGSGLGDGKDIADLLLSGVGFDFPQVQVKEPEEDSEDRKRQLIDAWNANVQSTLSPVDKILGMPGVAALVKELELDTENTTLRILPPNPREDETDK